MKLLLIVGTRPQIIKSIPLINLANSDEEVDLSIIHTGQHYDYEMTKAFFDDFSLPDPLINLDIRKRQDDIQISEMMLSLALGPYIKEPWDFMIVPGDTNSALASALIASKRGIPLAHMESGARSYNMKMPEEVNRRLIDHCSNLLFATTKNCKKNLLNERVRGKVCFTGDTMLDLFYETRETVDECSIIEDLSLEDEEYHLLTLHRPENVDNPQKLAQRLSEMSDMEKVVFPIHPRTRNRLNEFRITPPPNIQIIKPVGYIEMMTLVKHSKGVATDSGGLQKEAFWSGKLMAVMREKHEWPETVTGRIEDFGYGNASQMILEAIKNFGRQQP